MKPHLAFAHVLWKDRVSALDIIIDATCGNGHDTALLLLLTANTVYSIDIQPEAIISSKKRLAETLSPEEFRHVKFILGSHAVFPAEIAPQSVQLIVYNLGYLPGGDKSKTTKWETTLESLKAAMNLLKTGGTICITCYPGHAEGEVEQEKLIEFVSNLDRLKWTCSHHRWINREETSPNIILIEKQK